MGRPLVDDRAAMDGPPLTLAPFPNRHKSFFPARNEIPGAMAGHAQPFGLTVMALRP
jgi:hypothetical protein